MDERQLCLTNPWTGCPVRDSLCKYRRSCDWRIILGIREHFCFVQVFYFIRKFVLVYDDGWKIVSME